HDASTLQTFSFAIPKECCSDEPSLTVGDVNEDGWPDVVAVWKYGLSVFLNQLGAWHDAGYGLMQGQVGLQPLLAGGGPLTPGSTVTLHLIQAPPNAAAGLVLGASAAHLPFKGGVMLPAPDALLLGLSTDQDGELLLSGALPSGLPSGLGLYFQA